METVLLPNGAKMPLLGLGTWLSDTPQPTQEAKKIFKDGLNAGLEAGYRHIDTAAVYDTEKTIGDVLKKWLDSGRVKREELFIVTKLPPCGNRPGDVETWIKKSLDALQLDYVDLYLIHTPFAFEYVEGDMRPLDDDGNIKLDNTTNHIDVWKEMEKQVIAGRTRAIGLSNFNIKQIQRILDNSTVPVSNLQIELHINFQQKQLVEFCKSKGIIVTAYCPIGNPGLAIRTGKSEVIPCILKNPTVIKIAEKYNKTPAQIALKFIVQNGIVAIPKSTNIKRLKENINLFDFKLSSDDLKTLISLDRDETARVCDFSFFKGLKKHPEFPFLNLI